MEHPSQHSNVEFARLMYQRMINAQDAENEDPGRLLFFPYLDEPGRCFEHNGIVFICNINLLLAKWHIGQKLFIQLKKRERTEKYYRRKIEFLWQQNQANTKP